MPGGGDEPAAQPRQGGEREGDREKGVLLAPTAAWLVMGHFYQSTVS